jgi:hypothetical protein
MHDGTDNAVTMTLGSEGLVDAALSRLFKPTGDEKSVG